MVGTGALAHAVYLSTVQCTIVWCIKTNGKLVLLTYQARFWTFPKIPAKQFEQRSRTFSGIRNNFRGMFVDNISCPVCPQDSHIDTIPNLSNQSVTHSVKGTRHLTVKIQQYIFIRYYEAAWSNNSIYTAVGKAGKASAARYTRIIWSHEYMPYLVICAISCKYCATQVFVINLV